MQSSRPPARRHTLSFEPAAEARVAQDLARLSTGLSSELGEVLRSLLLVGPFARGEGTMTTDRPELCAALPGYDLLVVLRRAPQRFERLLPAISATWSRLLGARVALWPTVDAALARPPRTRAYFHAGAGQTLELLTDGNHPVACAAFASTELEATEVEQTLIEALCSLALARLEAPHDRERLLDRARRGVLGCGDAVLLAHGLYAATLGERADGLRRAGAGSALHEAYAALAAPAVPARSSAASADVDAPETLLRTLTSAVLELQATRTGCPRVLSAYLRSQAPAPDDHDRGFLAASRALLFAAEPRVPRSSLLQACLALALGDGAPDSLSFAARALSPALDARASRAPAPGLLANALRSVARSALAPCRAQPFGDWALVPEPG